MGSWMGVKGVLRIAYSNKKERAEMFKIKAKYYISQEEKAYQTMYNVPEKDTLKQNENCVEE